MNRTLLLPLSACLLFASCVTTYSTSRKYVAVDTPEGETVVMNGDTLRCGLTPRDMALELGVEPSGKNLARMSRIVYAANSPQTAYGFYDATPEPLSVEIHAADTTYSYRLAAYNSDLFWLNFLSLGIGMFEDRGNNNRYEHPDLYWTGAYTDRESVDRNYFRFGSDSPHRVEVGASWVVSEKVPFTLSWYTVLFGAADVNAEGERAYASYFEGAYPFSVKGVDMKAGVGMVPWNAVGTYGIDRDFYVQNVFLNAGKSWNIKGTESMSIGIFTNLVWNPAMEDVNFVGGFSFRM